MKARVLLFGLVCSLLVSGPARAQGSLLELVTDTVPQPIHIASAGDQRLFIVSRPGTVSVLQGGAVLSTPFLDIHDLVGTTGEGGLLSIAFHPNYATNGWVFVSYTDNQDDSVIARYTRSAADPNTVDPASGVMLFTVDQPDGRDNHKGGQLQFGPDGYLYFGLGDGGSGNDPDCFAQRRDTLLGKMLRLDVDVAGDPVPHYEIPAGNPFAGANDPNDLVPDEVWAFGLRNPWRFSFDRATGDLWIGDVGQNSREEVDFQAAGSAGGQNYGWKMMEGSSPRDANQCQPAQANCPAYVAPCDDPSYTDPLFEYDSNPGSRAITGGYVYRGSSAPDFVGRYLYADSSTGELFALQAGGAGPAELLSNALSVPVSFGEDADGELYLADLGTGSVYRLRLDLASVPGSGDVSACVLPTNQRLSKYAKAAEKDLRACVSSAARGKLGASTLAQCTLDDRKGALARQQSALEKLEQKRCEMTPAFGFTGSATAGAAADAAGRDLAELVFGADLDAAIATRASDRVAATCQQAVLKGLSSCQVARRTEFLRCKKSGLKEGSIASAEALAACLGSDARGRVARACDGTNGKLATRTVPRKCASRGVDLAAAFPGCGESAVADLALCLDAAGRCAHCRTFSAADGLDGACDLFDDGAANASCADPE